LEKLKEEILEETADQQEEGALDQDEIEVLSQSRLLNQGITDDIDQ
jgi:hypothetical protein